MVTERVAKVGLVVRRMVIRRGCIMATFGAHLLLLGGVIHLCDIRGNMAHSLRSTLEAAPKLRDQLIKE